MDTLKTTSLILLGVPVIIASVIAGMAIAYSFPGSDGPAADQKQIALDVGMGNLDSNENWAQKVKVYLLPFAGIEGRHSYSALVFVPSQNDDLKDHKESVFYLEASNTSIIQPVVIDASDFIEMGNNRIVVKLLDQGSHSGQYYNNAQGLTLNSQPNPKQVQIVNPQGK